MNEKDLKILIEIEKHRSLTTVAEVLYMTQPALTYRLQQIEKKMNAKLFNRGRLGIHPTVEGEIVVEDARKIMQQFDHLRSKLVQIQSKIKGTIRLGVASTFGQYLMPALLKAFLKEFPKVKAEITTGLSRDLTKYLKNGDIHVAILRGVNDWEDEKMLICEEPLYIASQNAIVLSELPQQPSIEYKMDRYLKDIVNNWWKMHFKEPPSILMQVDTLETSKAMANLGLGYTVLPGVCLLDNETLIKEPLKDKKGNNITRETWLFYHEETLNYPTVRAFVEFMDRYRHHIESLPL